MLSESRRSNGVSQAWVADRAGLSLTAVRQAEHTGGTIKSLMEILTTLDHELRVSQRKHPNGIGRFLAERRSRLGMTQRDVRNRTGLALTTIVALETRLAGRVQSFERYLDLLGLRPRLVPTNALKRRQMQTHRRLVPSTNSPDQDVVMTPTRLAEAIVRHFQPTGVVLDPCRGDRAFFNAFPKDVRGEWCEIREGRDFMNWGQHVDWIITNPPWSRFRQFLNKSFRVADNVVFLAQLTHFSTKARLADARASGFGLRSFVMTPEPTCDWPKAGFQLGAAHFQRGWEGPCQFIDRIEAWRHTVEIEGKSRSV